MQTESNTEFKKNKPTKINISFMFDFARAILYLTVAGFMFTSNQFDGYLGHGFVIGFATVSAIYGLFRLIRALYGLNIFTFK